MIYKESVLTEQPAGGAIRLTAAIPDSREDNEGEGTSASRDISDGSEQSSPTTWKRKFYNAVGLALLAFATFLSMGYELGQMIGYQRELALLNPNSIPTAEVTLSTATLEMLPTYVASGRVLIDVTTYAEGISAWKELSVPELLALADVINGTLVEPCMHNGRLNSCSNNTIPVSEVLDLSAAMYPPNGQVPRMISHEKYTDLLKSNSTTTRRRSVCMTNNARDNSVRCPTSKLLSKIPSDKLREQILGPTSADYSILHLEDYWRGGDKKLFDTLKKKRKTKIPQLEFHPKHYKTIDDVLRQSNITNNLFSAIHFRAEREGMDFHNCAKAVVDARSAMMQSSNITSEDHPFVLMTSLNLNPALMWSGSRSIAGGSSNSTEALSFLLYDKGFYKIDDLLKETNKLNDPGMLAVYDLILAQKASKFATCARDGGHGCSSATRKICESCNHVGKFGKLALSLRKGRKDTWGCWPQTKKIGK